MSATREAVTDAITQAFRDQGAMLTRWTLLAEVIDHEDGGRSLWVLAPPESTTWDTLGLLAFATQLEQAAAVQERLEDV